MSTIIFVLTCVGIGVLIFWAIKNKDVGSDGAMRGLFAMKEEASSDEDEKNPRSPR